MSRLKLPLFLLLLRLNCAVASVRGSRADVHADHSTEWAPSLRSTAIFVSPTGSDTNSGLSPSSPLASCAEAVRRISATLQDGHDKSFDIQFAAGTYAVNHSTACGAVRFRATEKSPIIFRPADGAEVKFDACKRLDVSLLRPVTNPAVRRLLNPAARDSIRQLPISTDSGWNVGGTLVWNGVPMRPSVWPNTGLGYVRKVFDQGAAREGWKGPPPKVGVCIGSEKSTHDYPCGANVSLAEQPTGDWVAEMQAGPGFGEHVTMQGYLNYDWDLLTHTIVRVVQNETNTSVQFGEWDGYEPVQFNFQAQLPGCISR
eukprot:COSAG02_NODE_5346_length_4413_cov_3.874594_3_plen_315_part_00